MPRIPAVLLLPSCLFAQSLVDYDRQVHPILAANCWSRHSPEKRPVYGETAGERPYTPIENPVPVKDLRAAIYQALGISPAQSFLVEKRPVHVTKDGKGKVIPELFA